MGRDRKGDRQPLSYPVRVLVEEQPVPCRLADISPTGARLILDSPIDVPPKLKVLMSERGAGRDATVIWRRANEIGVQFDKPARAPVDTSSEDEFVN